MLTIVAAALVGGPLTSALLWEHGAVLALLSAPLGGSAAGLVTALLMAVLHGRDRAVPAVGAPVLPR